MEPTVSLVGNLTREPTLISNDDGSAKRALFTIACNSSYKKDGEKIEDVDFIPCIAWNGLATVIKEWGLKGRKVHIRGVLKAFQKPVNEDGTYDPPKIQVKAEKIEFTGLEDSAKEKLAAKKAPTPPAPAQPALTQEALLKAIATLLTTAAPTAPTPEMCPEDDVPF